MAKNNGVSSPTAGFVPTITNPPKDRHANMIPGTSPRPARMSSPLDPPNPAKRRSNVNNEHDSATDKGFGSIPPGR